MKIFNIFLSAANIEEADNVVVHRGPDLMPVVLTMQQFVLAQNIAKIVGPGRKIDCIKLLRVATGMGLLEAKTAIEAAEIHPLKSLY